MKDKRRKRKAWWLLLLLPVLLALDMRLVVRTYSVDLPKLEGSIRLCVVADLHACSYGRGQKKLLQAIDGQAPDAVLLCGDFFDDKLALENARLVLEGISGKYPCYYVTGNHEYWAEDEKFRQMMELLAAYQVPDLSGKCVQVTLKGETINLCGVDDPANPRIPGIEAQLPRLVQAADSAYDTVLLCHRPSLFEAYCAQGFDLVLSGHAHGGQWRIPGLLNGLAAPDEGLFPKYAGGLYEGENTTMIVSRGLARESTLIPRVFNRPELVMVEIH